MTACPKTRPVFLSALAVVLALGFGMMATNVAAQESEPDSLRESFRDWVVNCAATPQNPDAAPGARVCELFQQLDQQDSGQRVLTFSVRISDAGEPVAVLIAPFGLRLSEGLRIRVGEEQIAHLAFETCLPQGCLVVAPMDEELVSVMQSGTEAAVVMISRQGEAIGIPVSLMGFTAGLNRLRALSTR